MDIDHYIPSQDDKLDPVLKAEWIKRLRSGDYPQTRGGLKRTVPWTPPRGCSEPETPVGYCCLGVLCEAFGGEEGEWLSLDSKLPTYMVDSKQYFGFTAPGINYDVSHRLANANDGGWTFHQIADWVEENL